MTPSSSAIDAALAGFDEVANVNAKVEGERARVRQTRFAFEREFRSSDDDDDDDDEDADADADVAGEESNEALAYAALRGDAKAVKAYGLLSDSAKKRSQKAKSSVNDDAEEAEDGERETFAALAERTRRAPALAAFGASEARAYDEWTKQTLEDSARKVSERVEAKVWRYENDAEAAVRKNLNAAIEESALSASERDGFREDARRVLERQSRAFEDVLDDMDRALSARVKAISDERERLNEKFGEEYDEACARANEVGVEATLVVGGANGGLGAPIVGVITKPIGAAFWFAKFAVGAPLAIGKIVVGAPAAVAKLAARAPLMMGKLAIRAPLMVTKFSVGAPLVATRFAARAPLRFLGRVARVAKRNKRSKEREAPEPHDVRLTPSKLPSSDAPPESPSARSDISSFSTRRWPVGAAAQRTPGAQKRYSIAGSVRSAKTKRTLYTELDDVSEDAEEPEERKKSRVMRAVVRMVQLGCISAMISLSVGPGARAQKTRATLEAARAKTHSVVSKALTVFLARWATVSAKLSAPPKPQPKRKLPGAPKVEALAIELPAIMPPEEDEFGKSPSSAASVRTEATLDNVDAVEQIFASLTQTQLSEFRKVYGRG